MKVILLQDVAKIGRRHSVVEVPDGFAHNKLVPSKAAIPATKENLARYAKLRAHAENIKESEAATLAASLTKLAGTPVVIIVQGNEKGHLFKAVTKEMIAEATMSLGAPIPADTIMVKPIKDVGEHTVPVSAHGKEGSFVVSIVAK